MKRFRNKPFATALLLAIILIFSSCDSDDYEWREGDLSYITTIPVNDGRIRYNFNLGYDLVEVYKGRYDRIDDIAYAYGEINIYTKGNYIDRFTLSLGNSNVTLPVLVRSNRDGVLSSDNDYQVDDFLNAVVEVIRRNGYATIYIDGNADGRFELDFYINVDAYVRY